MAYSVKEIFLTLQGEGAQAGRVAVFCRFSGCNLWTGLPSDRATAKCTFCDTDFLGTNGPGGGKFADAGELADAIFKRWPGAGKPLVVCTGGEPLLQLDAALVNELHARGMEVAVETNGTLPLPCELDWVCVSPKSVQDLVLTSGHELKLVFPQSQCGPEQFQHFAFDHFYLQPMDGPDLIENQQLSADYCLRHPLWRLCVQMHKVLGLP
jgi:7-carboxy-7-deazaguanine synthase (Cx14CxxC type)